MKKKDFVSPKQDFVESFDWRISFDWFDLQGVHVLDDERIGTVTLAISSVAGTYPGFQVEKANPLSELMMTT